MSSRERASALLAFARGLVASALIVSASGCVDAAAEGEGEGEGEAGEGVLEAEPASCELGSVQVGTVATCDVTLRNRGDGPLRIVSLLVDGAPSSSDLDIGLLPGAVDSVVVPLRVTPAVTGPGEVVFTFLSDAAPLEVRVRFIGVCSPTAVIGVTVNGAPASAPANAPFLAALSDDVVLSASASVPCPGRTIGSAQWAIVSQPAAASPILATADALQTGILTPFPGALEVALFVVDDAGDFSVNTAAVTVRYLPRLALAVDGALLLGLEPHVFRDVGANDERCGALDCFDSAGCGFLASTPPEWDGVAGRGAGDPLFEEAAGVSVPVPIGGAYLTGVYARGAGEAVATLGVDGSAPATSTRALSAGDFWTIARVTFLEGSAPLVEIVDAVEVGAACP